MKKKEGIITGLILLLLLTYLAIFQYGCFHKHMTWSEERFIGKKVSELKSALNSKGITLYDLNGPLSKNERLNFEELRREKITKNQRLYHFWGGKQYQFLNFPLGTVTLGAYVLAENEIIVCFVKNKSIDAL